MEIKEIIPKKSIDSELSIPGSKSYANRALIIAALAKGTTELTNVPTCDDTKYMLKAIQLLGVKVEQLSETHYKINPPKKLHYDGEIFVGGAGTTMRFLTSLCCLGCGNILLSGNERMCQRPIEDLVEALEPNIDGTIEAINKAQNGERCPPLKINSTGLKGGIINLKGDTSSQYLTSILLSAPYAKEPLTIKIIGDLTSKSYADITINVMKEFGLKVENKNYEEFIVPKQEYVSKKYHIESDTSGVSYFLAAAAITGGKIKITNISTDSVQGDIKFIDLLEKMGCKTEKGKDYLYLEGPEQLKGIDAEMNSMPDTAQTLAVLAAVAEGKTKITGISNLRVKETDRIQAVINELKKIGIKSEAGEDYLIVYGGTPNGSQISTYDDHRMAMSFAVLGLVLPGIKIENPDCVSKSFPEFWELFEKL
jgi:3-phosphoshikimate 1-carboxyvinyltransferase